LSRGVGRAVSEERDGQAITDAGIGFVDGKLAFDVNVESLEPLDVRITPVPGGVRPLTPVLILENHQQLVEIGA
jgi:methylenetetrahydrofolate dehydrogenase (NADP+) / methenyltetrahydrofolate cyclohydrolase